MSLSVLMIVRNIEEFEENNILPIAGLATEIIVVVNENKNSMFASGKKISLYFHKEYDLGKQRAYGLSKVKTEWVLAVDSDEVISEELGREIQSVLSIEYSVFSIKKKKSAYYVPFQNHFLGRPLHFGGENYKMLRLFRKDSVEIAPSFIHENFQLKAGKTSGELQGKLYHHSYRSLPHMFAKFTDYAVREARERYKSGEEVTLRKLFLNPPHMFWARFVEDKGYKDGIFRIPLDAGFAYMEFLMYALLFLYKVKNDTNNKSEIRNSKSQINSKY